MAESIQRIREYTKAGTEQLLQEGPIRDAVVWRLETIGEASTHLSPELKARHPEIPWRGVADFRNIVAHAYRSLQPDVVKRSSSATCILSAWSSRESSPEADRGSDTASPLPVGAELPYPVLMSLAPNQFRAGRVLMLAFLAVLLQRDVADLMTVSPAPRLLIVPQLLIVGICAVYGWFWLRLAGSDDRRRSGLALAALTILMTTFTLLDPERTYPFYYPYYYCAIVAGAAFSWRPALGALAG
jgi:uncharacterized protein with HEPN domain